MLHAEFRLHDQIPRKRWDEFVEMSAEGGLFARSWYMDAVMPGWGAVIVFQGDRWEAVMPLCIRFKFGIGYALQPAFSQYLGVLFAPMSGRTSRVLHRKRQILQLFATAIPPEIRLFSYNFSPEFDYFLPFVHEGFDIKPRTSLVLPLEQALERIVGNFSTSVLNHLKKASQYGLICREGTSIVTLSERMLQYGFIRKEAERQSLEQIWRYASRHASGFLLEVTDRAGAIQCSGLFLIEKNKAVFVASALDRNTRQYGSNSLLVLEAIKKCKSLGLTELDFKGSMLSGVEKFFLGFNPKQVLYFNITLNRMNVLEKAVYRIVKKSVRISRKKRV